MKKFSKILFFMFLCLFSIGFGDKAFASEITWNPRDQQNVLLSNNNLTVDFNSVNGNGYAKASNGMTSGKKYFEVKVDSMQALLLTIGATYATSSYSYSTPVGYYYQGYTYPSGTNTAKPYTTNDVIGVAIDLDSATKTVSFYLNGTFVATENIPSYTGQTIYPFVNEYLKYSGGGVITANFGATAFKYSIPTGFSAYNSQLASNISLNKTTDNIQVGQTDTIVATTIPSGVTVNWASSDSSIATVDQTGKVTAIKAGQATITATTTDGSNLNATCTVTVTNPVLQEITLNKISDSLIIGQTDNLVATTTPTGVSITWSSSDSNIATVDSSGKITAMSSGQATITVTTADGLTSTCVVNVANKTVPVEPAPTENEYIVNTARAKGDNTNNASGGVSIIYKGVAEVQLSVVKTADVQSVFVGDNFTYTLVVTNTSSQIAKAVVINDNAPNHIQFTVSGVTTTQGKVDPSSTSKNIIVNVGDIPPLGTVTIKIPATVIL